jgi:hypothetical protein
MTQMSSFGWRRVTLFRMLPKSGPYGGSAVYRCDGYGCGRSFSAPTVTDDLAALSRELPEGWTRKGLEVFCQDCALTSAGDLKP